MGDTCKKEIEWNGRVYDGSELYERCREIADATGVSYAEVIEGMGFEAILKVEHDSVFYVDENTALEYPEYSVLVTDMRGLFAGSQRSAIDMGVFDTSHVTNMGALFKNCKALTDLNLSGLDTSAVHNMQQMFLNCSSLEHLDLSSFHTGAVTRMNEMFKNCGSLKELDVSHFQIRQVLLSETREMFAGCQRLEKLEMFSKPYSMTSSSFEMAFDGVSDRVIPNWYKQHKSGLDAMQRRRRQYRRYGDGWG